MYRNSKGWIISVTGIVARDSSCLDMDTKKRKKGVIGRYRDGRYDIPWRCKRDMTHFRDVTRHPTGEDRWICIMGKNTYLSLEKRLVYRSIEECFDRLIDEGISRHIYVIGGNQLLQGSMQYINDLYLTTIDTRVEDGKENRPSLLNETPGESSERKGSEDELVYLDIELPWNMRLLRRDEYLDDRDDVGCVIEHYIRFAMRGTM
nr:MAG TPA: DHFR protein [Caudoviricetes sp.]